MSKIFTKGYILFLLISYCSIIFSSLVFRTIYPIHFSNQPLFFSDLLGAPINLPNWSIYILGFLNLSLIYQIGKIFFRGRWIFLSPLLFGISPHFTYLIAAGSFYIYLLCLILANFLALLLIKLRKNIFGETLFLISSILLFYSSILTFLIYPFLMIGVIMVKFISFEKLRSKFLLIFFLCLPIIILMIRNPVGLINIYNNQINFLSDPGLISAVDVLHGESSKVGFSYLSKFSENKYIYISKFLILKFAKNVVPSTFFTPEEKLLGFSFAPPFYFGLLIPFLYGIYLILKSEIFRKYLIVSLILIIPSVLSQKFVDLNRLILFQPVVVLTTVYGLVKITDKKDKMFKFILLFCTVIILIQFLVTIFDLNFREYSRFERYFGLTHWQI